MDATSREPADRFLLNFVVVLGVHAALLGGLWLLNSGAKSPPPEHITWLDGGGVESAAGAAPKPESPPEVPLIPQSEPTPAPEPVPEREIEPPTPSPPTEPDDLPPLNPQPKPTPLSKATPTPAPTPKATPKPTATQKPKVTHATPKPKPPPTPRKQVAKETQKPMRPPEPATSGASANTKENKAGTRSGMEGNPGSPGGTKGGAGSPGGSVSGEELQTYFKAVSNCYREVWDKPLTVIATGHDLSAIVRLRVSASGEVLNVVMQSPTGNREVDASIKAAFPKFQKVPPPPSGLLRNGIMEENMKIIYDL